MVGMVQICSNIDWLTVIDIIDDNDYHLVNRHRDGKSTNDFLEKRFPYIYIILYIQYMGVGFSGGSMRCSAFFSWSSCIQNNVP